MKLSQALFLLSTAVSSGRGDLFSYLETGYDFEGCDNDVGQAIGTDINDCFAKCIGPFGASLTPKCGAVSYYQGICYFKASRGAVTTKAGVNSTVVYETQPKPCAKIEFNTDYTGNDIANKPGAVTDCCSICQAYPGCRAYAWNNDNGGTCWLKSKRGSIIQKQGVHAGVAYPTDEDALAHNLDVDIDYVGHDIGSKLSSTAQGCFDICVNTLGCNAFSWSNYQQGTCWLKTFKGETTARPGVVSGVAVAAPFVKYSNASYDGVVGGLGTVPNTDNAELCMEECTEVDGCKFFVWNRQSHTCLLVSAVNGQLRPNNDVITGTINPGYTKCDAFSDNTDIVGNDIGSKNGISNADDCPAFCAATPGCSAYSWSNYKDGTCWFKNGNSPTKKMSGIKACTLL